MAFIDVVQLGSSEILSAGIYIQLNYVVFVLLFWS